MSDSEFHAVLSADQLREGTMRACDLGGREIVLCRTSEGLYALDNICTHAEARMSEGRLRGARIVCPLHGAAFDVRDGRVLSGPAAQPIAAHAVRIVNGMIEVSLT
jgi:nitrite reductase/ring-hydroxylating ferredoxin subunit